MASRQEREELLLRYYSPNVARALMRGTAVSGLARNQARLRYEAFDSSYDGDDSWYKGGLARKVQRKQLIASIRRRRREGVGFVPLSNSETRLIESCIIHNTSRGLTVSLDQTVRFWNKLCGGEALAVVYQQPRNTQRARRDMPVFMRWQSATTNSGMMYSTTSGTIVKALAFNAQAQVWQEQWVSSAEVLTTYNSGRLPVYFVPPVSGYSGEGRAAYYLRDVDGDPFVKLMPEAFGDLLVQLGMKVRTRDEMFDMVRDQYRSAGHGVDPVILDTDIGDTSRTVVCADVDLPRIVGERFGEVTREMLPLEMGHYHRSRDRVVGSREGRGRYTLGMEWEIEPEYSVPATRWLSEQDYVARLCPEIVGNTLTTAIHMTIGAFRKAAGTSTYVYPERDSTISEGFEMVFAYRTVDKHREIFERAKALDAEHPWRSTLCHACGGGIHVHVGRRRTDGTTMSNAYITMMANFVHYTRNAAFIELIARRRLGSTRYVRRPGSASGLTGLRHGNFAGVLSDHYIAVNVRDSTLELRIFDSTSDPDDMQRALEFTDALANYVEQTEAAGARYFYRSWEALAWSRLRDFVLASPGAWPLLAEFMMRDVVRHQLALEAITDDTPVEFADPEDDDGNTVTVPTPTITVSNYIAPTQTASAFYPVAPVPMPSQFIQAISPGVFTAEEHRAYVTRASQVADEQVRVRVSREVTNADIDRRVAQLHDEVSAMLGET